jgi:uncharacterized protein YkwD
MMRKSTAIGRVAGTVVSLTLTVTGLLAATPFIQAANAAYVRPSLSGFDARLVTDINHARAAHGLHTLVVAAGTTDVAHHWSCHLASQRTLAHNGRLASQLATHGSRYWTVYAENVGVESTAASADALFKAYMNSPAHRANILSSSARFIGVWTKRGGSRRFNTIDFVGATTRSYNNAYGVTRATC